MKIYKFMIEILLALLIVFILFSIYARAGDLRTTMGTTSNYAPGCENDPGIIKRDIGYIWNKSLSKNFTYDKELYETFIQDDDLYIGAGSRLRLKYHFTDNLNIFAGAGVLYIDDGGKINSLADSWLYGSLEAGIEYRNFIVGVDHVSSPFHHADEGDSGLNIIFIGFKVNF